MPQIEVESYYMHQVFEQDENGVKLPEAGVTVTFVDRSGCKRESNVRLRVDMHGELVLETTEGRLVLRPSMANNIVIDLE